jgi:hypothetical protein
LRRGVVAGRPPSDADHAGTAGVRDLGDCAADPAGDPEHRDGLVLLHLCGLDRTSPTDDEVNPDGGGFGEAEPFGFAGQRLDGNGHQLGVRSIHGEADITSGSPHLDADPLGRPIDDERIPATYQTQGRAVV